MDYVTSNLSNIIAIFVVTLVLIVAYVIFKRSRMFVYINSNEYGVVEKIWSRKGSVRSGFMSLEGHAGYQPELLRTGLHIFTPFVYRIHRQPLITVRNIGYVYARDGLALLPDQTLASTPRNVTFEDARSFLINGGQRGPQRAILREGIYAINTALLCVLVDDKIYTIDVGNDRNVLQELNTLIKSRDGFLPVIISGGSDNLGVVTVHDGPALEHDAIIAPTVGDDVTNSTFFHNSFQNIEPFLAAGGRRGRQEQVIVEGTYFVNRLFATIEIKPKSIIEIGTAGVVISYTGKKGVDISGESYKHGELVSRGERGVWSEALRPGKYPINPYALDVKVIPTTNFVLRWIKGRVEDHGYDSGLMEIPLITRDAFQCLLPLSIVVHISPEKAPRVIQQFADIKLLVNQTIDPMVSAFFKDIAQGCSFLELLSTRAELQASALNKMKTRFITYDLDLQEVMIGTPRGLEGDTQIELVLTQLRQRQVAIEQKSTYSSQQLAAIAERELNEAKATAEAQFNLTKSSINITVAENEGSANLRSKEKEADAIKILADANAHQITTLGDANANQIRATGLASADATKAQVAAYTGEGAEYQLRRDIAERFAIAIEKTTMPLVPNVMVQGQTGSQNLVEALLAISFAKSTSSKHTDN